MSRRALGIVLAIACGAAQALAAEPGSQLVFTGLRPIGGEAGATELGRIAEAQRLRTLAENSLELVSGRPVVGHEALREKLGDAYLVDLFDCTGDLGCVARLCRPLRRGGLKTAVYGEYRVTEAGYRFRLTTFALADGTVIKRSEFELPSADVLELRAWQPRLEPLVVEKGRIRIVTNAPGYACTIDGEPCTLSEDASMSVAFGEHVIELSRPGYQPASRVVTVKDATVVQVAVPLVRLPIQREASPTRLTEGIVARKEEAGVTVLGRITLSVLADPLNRGEVYDSFSYPASEVPREWHLSLLPYHSYLGASVTDERRAGWRASGLLVAGLFTFREIRVLIAQASIAREDLGFSVTLGRLFPGTVNSLEPGTLSETAAFGNLNHAVTALKVSQALGSFLLELGLGRPEDPILGPTPQIVGSAPRGPLVEGRLAFVRPGIAGRLYGQEAPLTIGISGGAGLARVGPGEDPSAIDPAAVMPRTEDLPVWVASAEALLPFGPFILCGEAYTGAGAALYGGALFQLTRLDPATGVHSSLRSAGFWGQLSYRPGERWELLGVAGQERVLSGLGRGITLAPPEGVSNLWVAAVATWYATKSLRVGLQGHYVRTRYRDVGTGSHPGGVLDVQLNF